MPKLDFDAEPIHDAFVSLKEAEPELADKLLIRVGIGGSLFDGVRPGWARLVRLDTLDMATTDRDVVGQVFGDWATGIKALTKPLGALIPESFGLALLQSERTVCVRPGCDCKNTEARVDANFAALNALWVRMVLIRLEDDREGVAGA